MVDADQTEIQEPSAPEMRPGIQSCRSTPPSQLCFLPSVTNCETAPIQRQQPRLDRGATLLFAWFKRIKTWNLSLKTKFQDHKPFSRVQSIRRDAVGWSLVRWALVVSTGPSPNRMGCSRACVGWLMDGPEAAPFFVPVPDDSVGLAASSFSLSSVSTSDNRTRGHSKSNLTAAGLTCPFI